MSWILRGLEALNFTAVLLLVSYFAISRLWLPAFENWNFRRILQVVAGLLGLYFVAVAVAYVLAPSFCDHLEASVAAKTLMAAAGEPIYTALDDARRISLLYGPSTYLVGMALVGIPIDPITASKLAGVLSALGGLVVYFVFLRRRFHGLGAVAAVGYCLAVLLLFRHFSFWNRPDSAIFLGVAVACAAVFRPGRVWPAILVAAGTAFAVDAKPHAFLYLLPLVPPFVRRVGGRAAFLTVLMAVGMAFMPYLIFPSFALGNHLAWLRAATAHGLEAQLFMETISQWFVLSIPFGVAAWLALRGDGTDGQAGTVRSCLYLYLACGLAVAVIASKAQAGPHHVLPFAPVVAALTLWCGSQIEPKELQRILARARSRRLLFSLALTFAVVMVVGLYKSQSRIVQFLVSDRQHQLRADLLEITARHPGECLVMGYGSSADFDATFLRPLLYKNCHKSFLDASALMDMAASGIPLPDATVEMMASRKVDMFVLPRGSAPFSLGGYYRHNGELFSDRLREAFLDNYHPVDSSGFYVLWAANQNPRAGTTPD